MTCVTKQNTADSHTSTTRKKVRDYRSTRRKVRDYTSTRRKVRDYTSTRRKVRDYTSTRRKVRLYINKEKGRTQQQQGERSETTTTRRKVRDNINKEKGQRQHQQGERSETTSTRRKVRDNINKEKGQRKHQQGERSETTSTRRKVRDNINKEKGQRQHQQGEMSETTSTRRKVRHNINKEKGHTAHYINRLKGQIAHQKWLVSDYINKYDYVNFEYSYHDGMKRAKFVIVKQNRAYSQRLNWGLCSENKMRWSAHNMAHVLPVCYHIYMYSTCMAYIFLFGESHVLIWKLNRICPFLHTCKTKRSYSIKAKGHNATRQKVIATRWKVVDQECSGSIPERWCIHSIC